MMGARLGVPVVPVRIEGLDKVLHPKMEVADEGAGAGGVRRADHAAGRELQ